MENNKDKSAKSCINQQHHAIRNEIESIERRIEWEQVLLNQAVKNFKACSEKYDAYHIVTFVPGMVEEVAKHKARLEQLGEQKAMLEYLLKQQEV